MNRIAALLVALLAAPAALANPYADNWTCRAKLDLQAMVAPPTAQQVDEAHKCASQYLTWAKSYAGDNASAANAVTEQHAAFVAYAGGLQRGASNVETLRSALDAAEARLQSMLVGP
jgi:hypothetical protein